MYDWMDERVAPLTEVIAEVSGTNAFNRPSIQPSTSMEAL